jgi:hypothetical protein
MMLVTEYKRHQYDKCYNAQGHNGYRYGFRNTPEAHHPTCHSQRCGTDEKHGRIYNKQKINTVLKKHSPEHGLVVLVAHTIYEYANYYGYDSNS